MSTTSFSGGGADSIDDRVSRSCTMDCMRCDWSAIMPEVAVALLCRQFDFLHGFQEAGEYGQRRAQFVRHVGHEVAARLVEAVGLGDVLDLHEPAAAGVGNDMDGIDAILVALRAQGQRPAEIERFQVGDEFRLTHQVDDRLSLVGIQPEAELGFGRRVAEHDVVLQVEHHHAIGQRLRCGAQQR